ncbi:MAG: hypothetical protein KGM17_15100 [Sphingomonadales bacterium]|nr:hypothetical protein [Sphingomonadales bacterium]
MGGESPGRRGPGRFSAPAVRLGIAVHGLLALALATTLLALAMPRHGIGFVAAEGRHGAALVAARPDGASPLLLDAAAPVTLRSAAGVLAVPAGELVNDHAPPGGPAALRAFYARADRIAALAAAPGARAELALPGGTVVVPLARREATPGDLPLDVWLLLAQGCAIGLLGAWMGASAPGHRPARLFAASCGGVLLAALSGAVFDARGLTGPGTLLQVAQALNFIGTNLCAVGLAVLFLHVPRDLVPPRVDHALFALATAAGALEGLGAIPLAGFYAGLLLVTIAFVAIFLRQWRLAAGDPAGRAVLRWIGVATFASAAFLTVGMAAPVLLGTPALASDGMSIIPLFAIYGAIAFGVGRVRLFTLDRWSYRLVLGVLGVALLLVADAALAQVLRLDRPLALALALLVVGYGYLPLRTLVLRLVTGRRPVSGEALFRQAALAAFAATAAARREGWRELLDRLFEPLEIAPLAAAVTTAELREDGAELALPATADDGALRLRFARRGSRLFSPDDLATARQLVALSAEAARARAEYARGVTEERQRIARDLHDDVSGLLLTGLHRTDVGAVRGDLRQALGEIRTMVASLAGRSQPLSVVLADIRFETAARVEAAGIALDWPVSAMLDEPDPELGYAHHKALTSALREIVTNAIKHARATRLSVRTELPGGFVKLSIADDGVGIAAGAPGPRAGHGLGNVRQRLHELGGSCAILPGSGGFRVELLLPLPAATAR